MKNIHVIPTDKPSRLACDFDKLILNSRLLSPILYKTKHIYIASDEEIKEGDYFIALDGSNDIYKTNKVWLNIIKENPNPSQKIILTTDQDLIKDGVQAIDDEFLEWFVKNPSCEEIEVESNYRVKSGTIQEHKDGVAGYEYHEYKIIIPKEETKQHVELINDNIEEFDKAIELFKQETLEEAAVINYKKLYEGEPLTQDVPIDAFKQGTRWQQERSYSEEEVLNKLTHFAVEIQRQNKEGVFPLRIKEWFERNKKK